MDWDPHVLQSSLMFRRVQELWQVQSDDWPDPEVYNALWKSPPCFDAGPVRFQAIESSSGLSFEQQIIKKSIIGMRLRHWHDHFNNLSWLAWPHTKSTITARYVAQMHDSSRIRSSVQNALAQWDECGAIVLASRPVLEKIQAHAWGEVFESPLICHLFGHGLMEKALLPYLGLTAKAVLIELKDEEVLPSWEALDKRLAEISLSLMSPRQLQPFPILGVKGWWEHQTSAFYQNEAYFRPHNPLNQSQIYSLNV